MDLKQQAEEYFSSINSIAARLITDKNHTKASYEDYWNELLPEEQEQIINESIIDPEAQLKYQFDDIKECHENEEYSVKMIVDENLSYRDEHSAPFSFKTKSQRDLTIFSVPKEEKVKPPREKLKVLIKKEIQKEENNFNYKEEEHQSDTACSLPKTGLDFLDNW